MDNQQDSLILKDQAGAIATLTLNRPGAYNAMSVALMGEMLSVLEELDQDASVSVVVIEGSGRGFCAGHDLKELRANEDVTFREEVFSTCSQLMTRIVDLRQPVIAKVHGIATAAGCQLVASCDLAIADDATRFATPGVNLGLFCSTPMVALSRAVAPKHAMEMLLTGDFVDASTAVAMGLINRAVPAVDLDYHVRILAEKIASKSPLVLKTGKQAFYRQSEMGLADAYDYCSRVMVENMEYRDAKEGIAAFLDGRAPGWTGE